jgi:hypothetical protein
VRVHPVIAEAVRGIHWNDSVSDVRVMELHKKVIDIYVGMGGDGQILKVLKEAGNYRNLHKRHIITAMYFDMLGAYYDVILGGNYIPQNERDSEILRKLISSISRAADSMERSSDKRKEKYLVKYYLSAANVLIRSYPENHAEAEKLLYKARERIRLNKQQNTEDCCYYFMSAAWYFTLAKPDLRRTENCVAKAADIAGRIFKTDLEIIDIICIPAANCYFYHGELNLAAETLEAATALCEKHSDMLPYIYKRAELLSCLLDVYTELQNFEKCRELISEIDRINEAYADQGIHIEVSPDTQIQQ